MVKAAQPVLLANSERLRELLSRSNHRLSPLEDPLLTDYGVHEWLSRSREEAYSNWLAWVLRQIEPSQVFRLFKITDPVAEASLRSTGVSPEREQFTPQGHPGHTGLIDFEWKVPGKVLIQVEVKLTAAEDSDLEKQKGYSTSSYGVPKKHRHRRLLATSGEKDLYAGEWRLVTWRHAAVELRRIATSLVDRKAYVKAWAVLGFVGAVEQKLLEFSSSAARLAFEGKEIPVSGSLASHMQDCLSQR